jgi:hypothetical protein
MPAGLEMHDGRDREAVRAPRAHWIGAKAAVFAAIAWSWVIPAAQVTGHAS